MLTSVGTLCVNAIGTLCVYAIDNRDLYLRILPTVFASSRWTVEFQEIADPSIMVLEVGPDG